ncbi:MAG: DUF2721 domain-containing protein [Pirellulales bacterium]|nr:DUF2721 domain-containing protein [Pirellulales bacterium]
MQAAETIRELAIPVVMISANGLICLALYNRLAAITTRLRLFFRERFDLDVRLVTVQSTSDPQHPELAIRLRQRLDTVDQQCQLVLRRAKLVRNSLIMLLLSVVGMLVITLLLGLSHELPWVTSLILSTFVVSVILMIVGVTLAICELTISIEPVEAESLTIKPASSVPSGSHLRRYGGSKSKIEYEKPEFAES